MASVCVSRCSTRQANSRTALRLPLSPTHARLRSGVRARALPKAAPTLSLLGVAVLWSTYGPTMRVIFADPGSPTPIMLSAIKAVIGTSALLGLAAAFPRRGGSADSQASDDNRRLSEDQPDANAAVGNDPASDTVLMKRPMPNLQLASLELGSYAAVGTLIHAWGLSQVPATTAGFLLQVTTVLTPLIAVFAGDRVSPRVWAAIAIAGTGTVLIGVDGIADSATAADTISSGGPLLGKLAILGAACCYSLGTFRLGQNSPCFNSINLAAGKNTVRAAATIAVAVPELAAAISTPHPAPGFVPTASAAPPLFDLSQSAAVLSTLWPSAGSATAVALVAWAGLGPGALGSILQTYGQRSVSPPVAQVIFTAIPVLSAGIAITLLHEQPFHALGWTGAALIVAAGLAIAQSSQADAAAAAASAAAAAADGAAPGAAVEEKKRAVVATRFPRRGD
eukprot:jgi/Ulvmu1/6463/UM003_0094.1